MARKDSEDQKKSMSVLFRGRAIFKPLNTGRIDEHVSCVREWVANIFFYTKNGTTIMIDAGYNYERLKEKMGWLDIDPSDIHQIFITHQDTDHVGALERDSELLFRNAEVYIGEIENRYLTGETRRKVIHGLYKLPMVKTDNPKRLLKDGEIVQIGDIRVECILVPGHTWGHMVYLVDDQYLFTGDTIWFGADGGYSFISTLAEDNQLAVRSLEKLEKNLRARKQPLKIITGHTGWTDDLDFAFRHRTEICKPFTKKYRDPSAPYDGYIEDDDTEESARNIPLSKVSTEIREEPRMGLLKKYFSQTRRPEGFLGRVMLSGMNSGHAKLADWGLLHLPDIHPENAADLGCGGGRNAGELLRKYPEAHVTAVDYSELSVQKAKDYNKDMIAAGRCTVLQRDVSDLQLPAGSFDLATAFETIYFWPGLEKCFVQAAAILKPGGYFLICNESDGTDPVSLKFEKIIDGMKNHTAEEIETALKTAGFREVLSFHHPSKPWLTVLAKK